MTVTPQIVIIGLFTGFVYAILAAGLVLIYRATRVINFAYGEMGAFGSAVLGLLVLRYNWPYAAAFVCVLLIGAAVGGLVELTVVRRLFKAPRLIMLVATIGVSQVLFFAQAILPSPGLLAGRFPTPIDRSLQIGSVLLRSEHFMVLAFVPACIIGLAIFLNRTPYGIEIRSTADNPDAARLAGISVKRVSTMVWVLAGVLATVTAVLIGPLRGGVVGFASVALGPSLLLRALTAALVGRLTSLPSALAGGVAVGVIEAVLYANVGDPGVTELVLFLSVLVLVFFRGQPAVADEGGAWSLSPKVRDVPERLREHLWIRNLPRIAGAVALALGLLLPVVFSSSERLFLFSRVLLFAVIALGVTILTGWAGQLSLGQFAFVGLGALTTAALHARGVPFIAAVCYGAIAGALAAAAIGAPALRIPGLYLAVTTLAFAVAARGWLFPRSVFFGDSSVVFLPRGKLGPIDLQSQRAYYYLCLALLVLVALLVARLRRTGIGRSIIAVRNNELSAASYTVFPAVTKLAAFAISGAVSALAGGLLAGLWVQFGPDAFGPDESLRVVAMTIIGGLGSVSGSIMGAVYVIGLPALFGGGIEVRLLTSGAGLLILLMYLPGGLVQVAYAARDALLAGLDRRLGARPSAHAVSKEATLPRVATTARRTGNGQGPAKSGTHGIRAQKIAVHFGGVHALEGVSIDVRHQETVGLIGSNGAGKSTLMNVISGFITPSAGQLEILGQDVNDLSPHERARIGVGRVFQDARLFSDLSVRESIQVALEARERSELVPSLLAFPPSLRAERKKKSEASELIHFLGLGRYADAFISDLSTGTRRIVELCCLMALNPAVLLLDEPTAGVAQKETEAFGPLIKRIQKELGACLLLIEHDLPLVMSISDRIYCLGAGRVIAEGSPNEVRTHPDVVASYLGTDDRAILRSGAAAQ